MKKAMKMLQNFQQMYTKVQYREKSLIYASLH